MKKEMIPLAKGKRRIVIENCAGSLNIRQIDEPVLRLKGEDYEAVETEDGYEIRSTADLTVYLFPETELELVEGKGDVKIKGTHGAIKLGQVYGSTTVAHAEKVIVSHCYGDVVLKHLTGEAILETVKGDVVGRHIRSLTVNHVDGDCSVKHCAGDVTLGEVRGDCLLTYVSDAVSVASCMHDILLSRMGGIVQVNARGDIRVKGNLPDGKHQLSAGQDVALLWPVSQPLSVTAKAAKFVNRLDFDSIDEAGETIKAQIGQGGPHLEITAGGSLIAKSFEKNTGSNGFDFRFDVDFDPEFGQEFGQEMEAFGSRMATMGEEIASKISRKMAEISTQLEGQFKAMRKKEEAVRRASDRMSRYGMAPSAAPPPPAAPFPANPASTPRDAANRDSAKLKVLQILEEGKISVEEANTLLKALE